MFELRPFQLEALRALSRDGHVLCIAPTGSGKSLIYERACSLPGTRTVLITPLVALARQQDQRLRSLGIPVALGAGATRSGGRARRPTAQTGVWILSPEMLRVPARQDTLHDWKPNFLVVDECHCLWEWGEDFRPAFQDVPRALERFGIKKSLWLSATLPLPARDELRAGLPPGLIELGRFDLPGSLRLDPLRVPWSERSQALLDFLGSNPEPGIIFCGTRTSTERLSRLIRASGRRVAYYHAGMSAEERESIERSLRAGASFVVIATSAFGLGMDFTHLRWVLLWQAPSSLLQLAQAAGRVGRAGRSGRAVVFWDPDDFRLMEWMIRGSHRKREQLMAVLRFLESPGCRIRALRAYFEAEPGERFCGRCHFCSSLGFS